MKIIESSLNKTISFLKILINYFINELVISIFNNIKNFFNFQKILIENVNSVIYIFNDIFFNSIFVNLVAIDILKKNLMF